MMPVQANGYLEAEIRQLETLDLADLRKVWLSRLGRPPRHASADLLRWRLAYELQAIAFGGIHPATVRQLEKLRQAFASNPQWSPLPYRHLAIGTVLTK